MPAAHAAPVAYPWTDAADEEAPGRARSQPAAAVTATVLSRAVPTAPPTCWEALTRPDATPVSRGSTPCVARVIAGVKARERPNPKTTVAGRITSQ